jgi:hypothetical protein
MRHRWRVFLQAACRVVRWRLSTGRLVEGSTVIDQFPELCWEIGEHVVEWEGPADLELMALVTVGGKEMPLAFQREPAPPLPQVDAHDARRFGAFEKADPACQVCGQTFCSHGTP